MTMAMAPGLSHVRMITFWTPWSRMTLVVLGSIPVGGPADRGLQALIGRGTHTRGWGTTETLDVGGTPVFVKRIPVTDLELEHRYSPRNLYRLPTFYHYGIGSAGFGVFRELLAHVKTT